MKEKGSGVLYLRKEKPLEEFAPKKNPNPGHEDIQGMLLELGRIYAIVLSAILVFLCLLALVCGIVSLHLSLSYEG